MAFKEDIVQLLAHATKLKKEAVEQLLEVPPAEKLGDYAFPCFVLAKKLRKNPVEIAKDLAGKLKLQPSLGKAEAVGPYINLFQNSAVLAEHVLDTIAKKKNKYGLGSTKKRVVVEYCGPNTNKPLHLGHLRNMALGKALCLLLAFHGNTVHPVNIVNDRGIHICQSMLAYQKWGKNKKPDAKKHASGTSVSGGKKGDHFVGDYYVKFAQESKNNPELMHEAQTLLFRWEKNDKKVRALWKKMNRWVLDGFAETYKRFGVRFDKEYYESVYYEKGKEFAFEGLKKGVFVDDQQAIVAPLEPFGLGNKVLVRGDGTSVYITQDMAVAQQRYSDFKFDQMIYVVASEQQLHFKQLFKVLALLQRPFAEKMYHFSYGLVNLPSGRMKSREGTVVDADDIMNEVVVLAAAEVEKRYSTLSAKEKQRRAEFIGLGAIKFFLLKVDPVRDMVFDPDESIRFDGETGPYLQYTHARACSILRKASYKQRKADTHLLNENQELTIVKLLARFPETAAEAALHYKPHIMGRYLLDLAQAFNEFYHQYPVISDDTKLMYARLLLVDGVRQVLENGLGLLGIEAPEEM